MMTVFLWLALIAVILLIVHEQQSKIRAKLAAENSLRNTAHGWISELMMRGFSTREIAMHTGIEQSDIDEWSCCVGRTPITHEIAHLIEMTLEARRAFIHIHQREMAARSLRSAAIE